MRVLLPSALTSSAVPDELLPQDFVDDDAAESSSSSNTATAASTEPSVAVAASSSSVTQNNHHSFHHQAELSPTLDQEELSDKKLAAASVPVHSCGGELLLLDSKPAALPTPVAAKRKAEPAEDDEPRLLASESKNRPSTSHSVAAGLGRGLHHQDKKQKPPPPATCTDPSIARAAAAAASFAPLATTTSATAVRTNLLPTSATTMTAPRNYKHGDDNDGDEQERTKGRNSSHQFYVEENEPPPVYDPNPVAAASSSSASHPSGHDAASGVASSHAAAAAAAATTTGKPAATTSTLSLIDSKNRKMGGSKPVTVARAAGPKGVSEDPTDEDADAAFAAALKRQGLEIAIQEGDGNCLFRAVSLQVYGDATMHGQVREQCLDFMAANAEHFGAFVTDEAFGDYLERKRRDGVHGNNPEIQAVSELFNRPVEVYTADNLDKTNSQGQLQPLNIFQTGYKTSDAPIRLSYHDGNHYNAVIDPLLPTAGLGLGLPGLKPGLADQMQVASAKAESDQTMDLERAVKASKEEQLKGQDDELQRALKESSFAMDAMYQTKAMALSDVDATNLELEQAVVESSLQTWLNAEHGRKKRASPVSSARSRRRSQQQQQHQQPPSPPQQRAHSNVASLGGADGPASVARASVPVARSAAASAASASVASAASAVAAAPAAASMGISDAATAASSERGSMSSDEYPSVVQELVMNGFDLPKVVRAYELVGDNFDDLLSFLMSNTA